MHRPGDVCVDGPHRTETRPKSSEKFTVFIVGYFPPRSGDLLLMRRIYAQRVENITNVQG